MKRLSTLAGWLLAIALVVALAAIAARSFIQDVIDAPAMLQAWGIELLAVAAVALPLGLAFKLIELYLSRRHRATSKS